MLKRQDGQAAAGVAVLAGVAAALAALCAGLLVAFGAPSPASTPTPEGSSDATPNGQGWTAPTHGRITSRFRPPDRPNHIGTDIANVPGTPIAAAAAGTVIQAECTSSSCAVPQIGDGCGWTVRIDHGGGIQTRYCHMRDRPLVHVGDAVAAGQLIGYMGSTGHSTGPHLHFECYNAGSPVDCEPFMKARGVTL